MEVEGINLAIGGTAVTVIAGVVGAWIKARYGRTRIDPQPLGVEGEIGKKPKYVTVQEFNRHVEDNTRDHENMFARMNANDKLTSKLEGILEGIREDLSAIKHKLFKTR